MHQRIYVFSSNHELMGSPITRREHLCECYRENARCEDGCEYTITV
jgi:hypothetical protein